MINCTKFFIMHYVWKIFSCGFQVGVIVASVKFVVKQLIRLLGSITMLVIALQIMVTIVVKCG